VKTQPQAAASVARLVAGTPMEAIVRQLEARPEPPPLAPEAPYDERLSAEIGQRSLPELFGAADRVASDTAAQAAKAMLLMWNDELEDAHSLSQGINSDTGSYVHGIMHRREPDFSNAKYWFRRFDEHPVYPHLREAALTAAEAFADSEAQRIATGIRTDPEWNPERFIEWCQHAVRNPDHGSGPCLRAIQLEEFRLLLAFCLRHAAPAPR